MKTLKAVQLILILLTGLLLIGCETQKGRIPSPDWSRGLPLGSSARGTIGMVVDEERGRVHLSWPDTSNGEKTVRYMQLDDEAEIQVDIHLPLAEGINRTPRLALANGENLHFLWAFRNGKNQPLWTLNYTQLMADGRFQHDPILLSNPERKVGSYQFTSDGEGGIFIIWESDDDLYLSHLTGDGATAVAPFMVVKNGKEPAIRIDKQDRLHLIWRKNDQIMYASLDNDTLQPAEGVKVARVQLGNSSAMDGPVLGLSDEWAYVLWSVADRGGVEAGTSRMEYIAFPIGAAITESSPTRLGLMPVEELPYEAYQGDYQMTQLASAIPIAHSSDFVSQPAAVPQGQHNEVAVVLAMTQQLRQQNVTQIATAVFKEGAFVGFNMSGKTEAFSQEPVIGSDTAGRLHAAWREGGHGQMVFYATTAPVTRDAINRFHTGDASNFIFNGGIEAAVGMMLFPLAFVWVLPSLTLLTIWHMRREDDLLSDPPTQLLLAFSFISYHTVKLLFWPFMTIYVPFSAWTDVPNGWAVPLQISVPLIIFGIGLFTAVRKHKKSRPYMSGLLFFFIAAAVDALLTLAIYGVNFLGVF